MPARADLLPALFAADERLAAIAPGAHVEARLRARLRGQAPSSRGPFGGAGRRLRRPVALAFAFAAVALIFFAGLAQPAAVSSQVASMPSAPLPAIHADGGLPDLPQAPLPSRSPRVIHAPAREEVPPRRDGDPPRERPFVVPPSAPPSSSVPERPMFEPGGVAPATPGELRNEGFRFSAPSRSGLFDGAPSPVLSAPPYATTPSAGPHPAPPHDTRAHPTSSPPPPNADPNADCKSVDGLVNEANAVCKQQGMVVGELTYLDPCGDGRFRGVDAPCVPEKQPDPKPNHCVDGDLGDGKTCQDATAYEQAATDACTASGLALVSVKPILDCPGGQSTKATFECCPSQPPQNQCIDGSLGDRVTCHDPSVLEQQAADACAAAGLSLTSVKLVTDCAGGQSTQGQYVCCPAKQ